MERGLPELPPSERKKERVSLPHFSRNQRGKEPLGHLTSLVTDGALEGFPQMVFPEASVWLGRRGV